ncbi:hypothetical protein [Pseudomonas sp. nanlin1]|uniref:hypothetical protein n=1 Tax=Pseudomonas sp. nanlin1 TaxID=3040605 RepID=UPI00388ED525
MNDFFFHCVPQSQDDEPDYGQRACAIAIAENPANDRSISPGDGLHTKFWKPGRTLSFRFVRANGTPLPLEQAQAIFSAGSGWLSYANLKFELFNALDEAQQQARLDAQEMAEESGLAPAELAQLDYHSPSWCLLFKVSFASTRCSSIAIGTDSRLGGYCMSLDLVPPEHPDFEAHVLHTFGHLLGLRLEHLHPDADVPWDVDKALEAFAKSGWGPASSNAYLFDKLPYGEILPMPYDPTSIMHLAIPGFVTHNGWEQPPNKCIGPGDIARARLAYPATQ